LETGTASEDKLTIQRRIVMQNQMDYTRASTPRKGLAIASLVLGIISIPTLGLVFVGGIVGIILGVLALSNVKSDPTQYAGKGLAIAGIITSALSLLIAIPGIIAAIAIPNLLKAQQAARETAAVKEVITIGQAQVLYSVTKGNGKFTNLRALGAEGLIDSALASGEKGGYMFSSEPLTSQSASPMFDTIARPVEAGPFGTGNRSFGSNETLVVYESDGARDLKGTATNRVPAGGSPIE
jgi:competence protein ComGC